MNPKKFALLLFLCMISLAVNSQTSVYTYNATDYYSYSIWQPTIPINVYTSESFNTRKDFIDEGEHFEVLYAKYYFYSFIEAKITKNYKNDFPECKGNLPIGSKIKLLFSEGECMWNILINGKLDYATFCFDYDNKILSESVYDGCHKIGGLITKATEHKRLVMKIKYKGKVGWIKMENKGADKDSPISFVCDKEYYDDEVKRLSK